MPFNLSTGEILVLLIVAVLVFGGSLPDVARKVARGLGEFRRGMSEEMRRIDNHLQADNSPADEAPADWAPPPDGADCDGFGNIIEAPAETTQAREDEAERREAEGEPPPAAPVSPDSESREERRDP